MYQGSLPKPARSSIAPSSAVVTSPSVDTPPLQLTADLPDRPPAVAAAVIAMIATAFVGCFAAIVSFVALHHFDVMFRPAVAPVGANDRFVGQVETMVRVIVIGVGVMSLIMSTVLVLLTIGILRGNRGARMGVWALCIFGTAWGVAGLVAAVLARSMLPLQSGEITAASVVRTAEESLPGWFPGVIGFLSLAQALGYVASAILLAAPAAGRFFGAVLRPWQPHTWSPDAGAEQAGSGTDAPAA